MPNPKTHKPTTPASRPAQVEDTVNIVEIRFATPVGSPPKLTVRWEVGDDSGDEYAPIRQESKSLTVAELEALAEPSTGGTGSVVERLHEALFALLVDAECIDAGVRE